MKLDFIENIEIYPEITPIANYQSIVHLKEGILLTYNNMKTVQDNYYKIGFPELSEEEIKIQEDTITFSIYADNHADAIAMNLIHWYSINLMSYAKCCGLIKFLNETGYQPERFVEDKKIVNDLRQCQNTYIESIPELAPIKHFRNKASAHLAFTDPKNDNAGTLVESMSLIPSLVNGVITIGYLKRSKGEAKSSFGDTEWNLRDNFESLIPRFFADSFGVEII
ncbi:MAG: hypothetical protein ACOH1O_00820 [Flavobacterium sp.]